MGPNHSGVSMKARVCAVSTSPGEMVLQRIRWGPPSMAASKHGLIGLTRTLAAEWGGRGVRVNAVCPGWVKTEMDVTDQTAGGYTDTDITGRVPMGRFAT
jgi:NAD(P)-dependent dehydrogenase (short-subunit alcohol dehydrogenase family)